jgi:hypothetical protein
MPVNWYVWLLKEDSLVTDYPYPASHLLFLFIGL